MERFRFRPRTGYLHRELGLPAELPLIVAIGQISLRKGHDVAAAALSQVAVRASRPRTATETLALQRRLPGSSSASGFPARRSRGSSKTSFVVPPPGRWRGKSIFSASAYFCDPRGQIVAQASRDRDEGLTADLDLDMISEVLKTWQFLRARRPTSTSPWCSHHAHSAHSPHRAERRCAGTGV